jgi:hypothetical protein
MKLSTEQLERLSERVFRALKQSGHLAFDTLVDEKAEDRVLDVIMSMLQDDARMEDRLSREAENLVNHQSHIARASGRSSEELIAEVKARLAKSKRVTLGDGPERSDSLAERVVAALWKVDCVDFYSDDRKVQNCIARAIYRFRHEDDRIVDAVEKLVSKRTDEEPYGLNWCGVFDRTMLEVKAKLAGHASGHAAPRAEDSPKGPME